MRPSLARRVQRSLLARSIKGKPARRASQPIAGADRLEIARAPPGCPTAADGCRCRSLCQARGRDRSGSDRRHGRSLRRARVDAGCGQPDRGGEPGEPGADDVDALAVPIRKCRGGAIQISRRLATRTRSRGALSRGHLRVEDHAVDRAHQAWRVHQPARAPPPSPHRLRRNARPPRQHGRRPCRFAGFASTAAGRCPRCRPRPGPRAANRAGRCRRPRRCRAGCWSAASARPR